MDKEGGRYLSPEDRERIKEERKRRRQKRRLAQVKALAGLLLGNGLLIYMIERNLIDHAYGVLLVAGVSVLFTYHIK